MPPADRRVYLLATACTIALLASVVIPRAFREPGGGFAAATGAAVTFLALAVIAAIASAALLLHSLRHRRLLSRAAVIAGALPAGLVVVGLLMLWQSIGSENP